MCLCRGWGKMVNPGYPTPVTSLSLILKWQKNKYKNTKCSSIIIKRQASVWRFIEFVNAKACSAFSNNTYATQFPNQSAFRTFVNARRSGFIGIATLSGNNFLLILTPRHYHDTTLDLSQVIVWQAWTTLGINLLVDIFHPDPTTLPRHRPRFITSCRVISIERRGPTTIYNPKT